LKAFKAVYLNLRKPLVKRKMKALSVIRVLPQVWAR
jgi:hypothetical protein